MRVCCRGFCIVFFHLCVCCCFLEELGWLFFCEGCLCRVFYLFIFLLVFLFFFGGRGY